MQCCRASLRPGTLLPRKSRRKRFLPLSRAKTSSAVRPQAQARQRPLRCQYFRGLRSSQQRTGPSGHYPRALILTPTRELCRQIEECISDYGKNTGLRTVSVFGGVDIERQLRSLRQGADIVVATPGRLLDHCERRSIDLSRIEILVLDEADRMYDMGFIQAVRTIIAKVPRERQTMLFSATMSREVRSLVAEILKNPQFIEVGEPFTPVETVQQEFYSVPQPTKMDLLVHILEKESIGPMLVFSRTKHGADKIARRLAARRHQFRGNSFEPVAEPAHAGARRFQAPGNSRYLWPPTLRRAASTWKAFRM